MTRNKQIYVLNNEYCSLNGAICDIPGTYLPTNLGAGP
jgi:hypothetical protein